MGNAKGLFGIVAAVSLIVALTAEVTAPSTAAATGAVRPAIQITGNYEVHALGGASAWMIVSDDGTWNGQWSGEGEQGYWLYRAPTVALAVTSGPDRGCLYLGKVGWYGIGNRHRPGISNCLSEEGIINSWFACNSRPGGCYFKAPGKIAEPVTSNAAVGTYGVVYDNGTSATMTVNANGTWSQTATGPVPPDPGGTDTGYWTSLGSAVALLVTSDTNEQNCLFLGQVTKHGLDHKNKLGKYICENNLLVGTWYATPNA